MRDLAPPEWQGELRHPSASTLRLTHARVSFAESTLDWNRGTYFHGRQRRRVESGSPGTIRHAQRDRHVPPRLRVEPAVLNGTSGATATAGALGCGSTGTPPCEAR